MQRALRAALIIVVAGLSGCVSFDTVRCGEDRVCQAGSRCDDHGGCIVPAQIDACEGEGLADGDECTIDGATGTCAHGGCVAWVCGDHIRNGAEECEDADLGGKTCLDLGWNNSTGLACNADCTFNQDDCTGGCGDNIKDETEQCDGALDAGTNCTTLGFYDPDGLTCSPYCRYDVKACKGFCGDAIVNGPEQCDSVSPIGESCLDYSFDRGRLGCTLCAPGFGGCTKLGWQHEVSPTSQALRGIWGAAPDDFFVVGNGGTVLRYATGQLTQVASVPTMQNLNAVWGTSATDVFAAGNGGTILHFDGNAFTTMTTTTASALTGLWGSDAANVYAVGISGTVVHYDGNSWISNMLGTSTLRAVWGSSASDVYAVGDAKTVFHFNGSQWSASSVLPGTFDVDLFAVWGSGPTDVYFAGNNRSNQPIVLHYDGAWTTVYTSTVSGFLSAAWGSGPTDVLYAGTSSTLHGDGMEVAPLLPPPGLNGNDQLWGLWGTPGGSVWTVGDNGYVAHWDGGGWTQPPALTGAKLRAVASVGPSDAYAVGSTTSGASYHYDGAWSSLSVPVASGDVLRSVWMSSSSFGVTVGSNSNNGVIYHYGGSSWAAPCAAATTGRNAVWGASASDVYAVGDADGSNMKAISHWDGGCWANTSFVAPSGVLRLFAVAGSSATDIFAAGQRSATLTAAMFHSTGSTWSEMPLPVPDPGTPKALTRIDGLWASSVNDVFAVGDGILHYNGSSWSNMTGPAQTLRAVAGTGPRNVFAVGDNARLLHYDGISWTPVRVPSSASATFRGVSATARSVIVVGETGSDGFAQRLSFGRAPIETNCRDTWDDDGDGLPDCADDDCAGDTYCTTGGACHTVNTTPLACAATVLGSTIGLTPSRDYYTCDANPETGPEAMYVFVPTSSGQVTVTLSDFGASDLDLVAVGAMQNSPACDPDLSCLGASSTSATPETVTFTATAGRPYYFIVDGRNGASGSFSLQVTCP